MKQKDKNTLAFFIASGRWIGIGTLSLDNLYLAIYPKAC
jgi:hypothetical protein